jgi:hypothetical protein
MCTAAAVKAAFCTIGIGNVYTVVMQPQWEPDWFVHWPYTAKVKMACGLLLGATINFISAIDY